MRMAIATNQHKKSSPTNREDEITDVVINDAFLVYNAYTIGQLFTSHF